MLRVSCIFCELMDTRAARWVADREQAVAFLPLVEDEFAAGHTLVVSRAHAIGVHDADEPDVLAVASLAREVARAAITALGASGVVVLNASGPDSGQTVPHLHFHVVPRWDDDEETLPWLRQRSGHRPAGRPEALLSAALRP
jgi:histidine triad (HIT) family protein